MPALLQTHPLGGLERVPLLPRLILQVRTQPQPPRTVVILAVCGSSLAGKGPQHLPGLHTQMSNGWDLGERGSNFISWSNNGALVHTHTPTHTPTHTHPPLEDYRKKAKFWLPC